VCPVDIALSPLFMSSYCWNKQDFELVKCSSFIFAADVIYSDDLTIALFSMLRRVMSFGCDKVNNSWITLKLYAITCTFIII